MRFSAAELESLIAATEKACGADSGKSPALVLLKQQAVKAVALTACAYCEKWRARRDSGSRPPGS